MTRQVTNRDGVSPTDGQLTEALFPGVHAEIDIDVELLLTAPTRSISLDMFVFAS